MTKRFHIYTLIVVGSDEKLIEMYSKQNTSFSTSKQTAKFDDSVELHDKGNRGFKLSNGEYSISATTTRARRHSACSYVTNHAINPGKAAYSKVQVAQNVEGAISGSVELNRPRKTSLTRHLINEACNPPDSQDTTSTDNAFVGLNCRRKTSLPSMMMSKPEHFLEGGGRIEVAKREINLDACMPLFTKDAERSNKKRSSIPLAKTEFNGWMREDLESVSGVGQGHSGRQRRVSLPVLKVDKSDAQDFPSCNSVPSLQNGFLSPPIPRDQSGSLVGSKGKEVAIAPRGFDL